MSASSPSDVHAPSISRDDLVRALRARDITLIDVLSAESFAGMHIPGAINLPSVASVRSTHVKSALARESCGDCVPREFAPALRTWMDQIQRMAGELEQI